jgi:hypothetical protein
VPSFSGPHTNVSNFEKHGGLSDDALDFSALKSTEYVVESKQTTEDIGLGKEVETSRAYNAGMDRLEELHRRHFYHPNLRNAVRHVVSRCQICLQVRVSAPPHGLLAPRTAPLLPWSEVHLDYILVPGKVTINARQMEFLMPLVALTQLLT